MAKFRGRKRVRSTSTKSESKAQVEQKPGWLQWMIVLNVAVIAVQPAVLAFILLGREHIKQLPVWGYGICLTWAFFIPVLVMLAQIKADKPPRWRQSTFLLTAFGLPVMMAVGLGESLQMIAFDLASYHSLGAALAFGAIALLMPFVDVTFRDMEVERFRLRPLAEAKSHFSPIFPILLAILAVLALLVAPLLAAELTYFRSAGHPWFVWVGRYLLIAVEAWFLLGLMLRE